MTITDFSNSDTFRLTGGQTVTAGDVTALPDGGTLVTISDGTRITLLTGTVTAENVTSYFHA
jgi:hypothetical protein